MLSDHDRAVIKGHIASLLIVKFFTTVLVLYYFMSWQASLILVVLSLPWIFAGAYYFGRNGRFRYRHWKYRHLRERLIREEWHVDEDPTQTVTRDRRRRQ